MKLQSVPFVGPAIARSTKSPAPKSEFSLNRRELAEVLHCDHFEPLQQAMDNGRCGYLLGPWAGEGMERGMVLSGAAILGVQGAALTLTARNNLAKAELLHADEQREELKLEPGRDGSWLVSLPQGNLKIHGGNVSRLEGSDCLTWNFLGDSEVPNLIMARSGENVAILGSDGRPSLSWRQELPPGQADTRLPKGFKADKRIETSHATLVRSSSYLHYQGQGGDAMLSLHHEAESLRQIRDTAVNAARRLLNLA